MKLQCPVCQASAGELHSMNGAGAACRECGFVLKREDGILRALAPDRRAFYQQFLGDYGTIRSAEGRGSHDRQYYLALPFEDKSGKNSAQWRIRASTWR